MNQLKLYENVVIGNFLYGLGSTIRAKSKSEVAVSSINLLQQTPLDMEIGDVLLEFPGIIRIIEFKQVSNSSEKEPIRVENLTNSIKENNKLLAISRAIHWFVETDPKKNTFVSRIVPYLNAYSRVESLYDSLEEFIEKIAEEAVQETQEFSPDDLREYLDFIQLTLGKGTTGSGGLIFAVDKKGNLGFLQLTNMRQLRLQHRDFIQQQIEEHRLINSIISQVENTKKTISNEIKNRRSGPSLGL
jgi:hypothetical protein